MDLAFGIVTAAIALAALVISGVALRRTSDDARLAREMAREDAALDRLIAGPIPHVSLISLPRHPDGHVLKIVVQNMGRTAITMTGGGLAFRLPDGGRRHITIRLDDEVRLDPEGAPRGYVLTAPVLQNVLDSADPRGDIRPFVILGTKTLYGDDPLPRELIEMAMEHAIPTPDQAFSVFDAYDDYIRARELRVEAAGHRYELSDGMYHAFLEIEHE